MYTYRITLLALLALLLGACKTDLENSRIYLMEGDLPSAEEALLKHAQEHDIRVLSHRDEFSGIDFLAMLEELKSPEVLTKVYKQKYSGLSPQDNFFVYSGRFAEVILRLSREWQMSDLQLNIAKKVEMEAQFIRNDKYSDKVLQFTQFAIIHLSQKSLQHPYLTKYWSEMPYEKYLQGFKGAWHQAKIQKSSAFQQILKDNLLKGIGQNKLQIIDVADEKELSFIFSVQHECNNDHPFDSLKDGMKRSIEDGKRSRKVALAEIEFLKPQILKSSDRLFKLEDERRDLQLRNQYTFEERVQCKVCVGRGEIQCGECRGHGVCRSCTRGHIDCLRCSRTGYYSCSRCYGRGFYRECQRVWDPCKKCYVERYVRVRCSRCCGSGTIDCRCFNGRITCHRCNGHFTCRRCNGRKVVDCVTCVGGTIVEVRKTTAGKEIDARIRAAQTEQSALLNRMKHLERLVSRINDRYEIFSQYLPEMSKKE